MRTTSAKIKFVQLMNKYYTLQCRCGQCGRNQSVMIAELAQGKIECKIRRLGQPSCNGIVELAPTQDTDDALKSAVMLLGYLNLTDALGVDNPLSTILDTIVDDVGSWTERHATPQEMGWVDSQGRP